MREKMRREREDVERWRVRERTSIGTRLWNRKQNIEKTGKAGKSA